MSIRVLPTRKVSTLDRAKVGADGLAAGTASHFVMCVIVDAKSREVAFVEALSTQHRSSEGGGATTTDKMTMEHYKKRHPFIPISIKLQ